MRMIVSLVCVASYEHLSLDTSFPNKQSATSSALQPSLFFGMKRTTRFESEETEARST